MPEIYLSHLSLEPEIALAADPDGGELHVRGMGDFICVD